MTIQDKEKLVRTLVNTFNDRNELHEAYKARMKQIIMYALDEFSTFANEVEDDHLTAQNVLDWIDKFVEERFKPAP